MTAPRDAREQPIDVEAEMRKGLRALRLEVDSTIVNDLEARFNAFVAGSHAALAGASPPEPSEGIVQNAVTAAWHAMWVYEPPENIIPAPTEHENPSLWRQVRAVLASVGVLPSSAPPPGEEEMR